MPRRRVRPGLAKKQRARRSLETNRPASPGKAGNQRRSERAMRHEKGVETDFGDGIRARPHGTHFLQTFFFPDQNSPRDACVVRVKREARTIARKDDGVPCPVEALHEESR